MNKRSVVTVLLVLIVMSAGCAVAGDMAAPNPQIDGHSVHSKPLFNEMWVRVTVVSSVDGPVKITVLLYDENGTALSRKTVDKHFGGYFAPRPTYRKSVTIHMRIPLPAQSYRIRAYAYDYQLTSSYGDTVNGSLADAWSMS